jgi:acetyl esterase
MLASLRALKDRLSQGSGELLVRLIYEAPAHLMRQFPGARRAIGQFDLLTDLPYLPTGLQEHTLDVWRPKAGEHGEPTGLRPAVLYVHGGGFCMLSKETHWSLALRFASHGFVVFNTNYRLAPRHPYPAAVEDVCEAFSWVLQHAAEHGADPRRIVLAGESAGANLVTALAVAASFERAEPFARKVYDAPAPPIAVIAGCGFLQVSDPERFLRRRRLPGWLFERIDSTTRTYLAGATLPEGISLADPLLVLERETPSRALPPFFSFVGTRDPILDDTRRLGAALERLGASHLERYYPGEMHAFHAFDRPQSRQCWGETFDFLSAHLAPA